MNTELQSISILGSRLRTPRSLLAEWRENQMVLPSMTASSSWEIAVAGNAESEELVEAVYESARKDRMEGGVAHVAWQIDEEHAYVAGELSPLHLGLYEEQPVSLSGFDSPREGLDRAGETDMHPMEELELNTREELVRRLSSGSEEEEFESDRIGLVEQRWQSWSVELDDQVREQQLREAMADMWFDKAWEYSEQSGGQRSYLVARALMEDMELVERKWDQISDDSCSELRSVLTIARDFWNPGDTDPGWYERLVENAKQYREQRDARYSGKATIAEKELFDAEKEKLLSKFGSVLGVEPHLVPGAIEPANNYNEYLLSYYDEEVFGKEKKGVWKYEGQLSVTVQPDELLLLALGINQNSGEPVEDSQLQFQAIEKLLTAQAWKNVTDERRRSMDNTTFPIRGVLEKRLTRKGASSEYEGGTLYESSPYEGKNILFSMLQRDKGEASTVRKYHESNKRGNGDSFGRMMVVRDQENKSSRCTNAEVLIMDYLHSLIDSGYRVRLSRIKQSGCLSDVVDKVEQLIDEGMFDTLEVDRSRHSGSGASMEPNWSWLKAEVTVTNNYGEEFIEELQVFPGDEDARAKIVDDECFSKRRLRTASDGYTHPVLAMKMGGY